MHYTMYISQIHLKHTIFKRKIGKYSKNMNILYTSFIIIMEGSHGTIK